MTMVRKIDGAWTATRGVVEIERMVATRNIVRHYADGRQEGGGEEPCDPYPVAERIDTAKVEQLVSEGVWGDADLLPYGLKVASPFTVPEGKRIAGPLQIVEDGDGNPVEDYPVEDIPPPPPPETVEQRKARLFADYGLTAEDFAPKAEADAVVR